MFFFLNLGQDYKQVTKNLFFNLFSEKKTNMYSSINSNYFHAQFSVINGALSSAHYSKSLGRQTLATLLAAYREYSQHMCPTISTKSNLKRCCRCKKYILFFVAYKHTLKDKNPAYGRLQISRPMRIEATIYFLLNKKKSIRNNSLFLRLYELVRKCISPPVKHLPHMDLPLVQSGTTPRF